MKTIPFAIVFFEGILTFVSPCILSMLPLYFAYLAGLTIEGDMHKQKDKKLIVNSLAFILGFMIVFVLLGASATAIGKVLGNYRDLLRKISGVIIIIFGLNFLSILKLDFLNYEKRLNINIKKFNFLSSLLFGIVFSLGWTPCIGVFLGPVLLMAGNTSTIGQGVFLLLIYSIGLGIPFFLSAMFFDKFKHVFDNLNKYQKAIKVISGIILIITGILIFTGVIQYLNNIFM